ncbi:MAG: hypothetical protein M3Y33_20975 [Actinomycetota bacterium]|nr:hypothetical protein [Actinomycetota bacterium]
MIRALFLAYLVPSMIDGLLIALAIMTPFAAAMTLAVLRDRRKPPGSRVYGRPR